MLLFKCEQILLKQSKNDQKSLFFSWSLTRFSANCLTNNKAFENYTRATMNSVLEFLDSLGREAACNPVLLLPTLFELSPLHGEAAFRVFSASPRPSCA